MFGFVRSALRRTWLRWPPRYDALKAARKPYSGPSTRQKWTFTCARCGKDFMGKEIQLHHKEPCGTLLSFSDLPTFAEKLFCEANGLEVQCKACHKAQHSNE